ncbi:MAG: hypothetical protein HN593_03025 [Lentimicrobiaceae bacterium]|jgi:transcription elongation GreA/GreB family factor|nr:hypothetical protein [Lentimicrobiaceae bacterium]MBT6672992.1 hypothetical protein [Lentimicrobiaceae bacterium]MBT7621386.1 hypothetical protein [Lentimicrobiaceae bacterium]
MYIKEVLLNKCVEQQQKVIDQLQKEIEEAQNQANDYGQPKDRYDAYRTKLMRQIELFAKQLDKANAVMNTLKIIMPKKQLDMVEFGSLVTTTKQKLFVSAGLGKIDLNGELWYAISPNVPIFNALKGKKVGESIVFKGNTITIKSIL